MEIMAHIDEENIIDESYDPFFFSRNFISKKVLIIYNLESWMVMDNYRAY